MTSCVHRCEQGPFKIGEGAKSLIGIGSYVAVLTLTLREAKTLISRKFKHLGPQARISRSWSISFLEAEVLGCTALP